jgi:hypothetical protein
MFERLRRVEQIVEIERRGGCWKIVEVFHSHILG